MAPQSVSVMTEGSGPDHALRSGIPAVNMDGIASISSVTPLSGKAVSFAVEPGPIDTPKVKQAYYAVEQSTKERFVVGYEAQYNARRGLSQTYVLRQIPALLFDRSMVEKTHGLWAHFIWPTAVAESAAHHLRINSYDRARFTFGFYQLAAHTPNDNLILLFRELLQLPNAALYFPDLVVANGVVCKRGAGSAPPVSLEREEDVPVGDRRETQIPDFMNYLNPTNEVDEQEKQNAAKLMHWLLHDPGAVETTIRVSFGIMQRKIARIAQACGLVGGEPDLAIWASDVRHQGRGSIDDIKEALSQDTLEEKREALYAIDYADGHNEPRRNTVRDCLERLAKEKRFDGIKFGVGPLAL